MPVETTAHTIIYNNRYLWGFTQSFLESHFLTMLSTKKISISLIDRLYYFCNGEAQPIKAFFTYLPQGEIVPVNDWFNYGRTPAGQPTIAYEDIHYPTLLQYLNLNSDSEGNKILAFTIQIGHRSFTYYFDHDFKPQLTLVFRNCFNINECIELCCITTTKQKVERSTALTNGQYSFYDQSEEQIFEVESATIPLDVARWIEQLFTSHKVRFIDYSYTEWETLDDFPEILITESSCEISDSDENLNKVKFSYRFTHKEPRLHTRFIGDSYAQGVFTSEFNTSFS